MNIAHWLSRSADVFPGNVALIAGSRRTTYREFARSAAVIAGTLRDKFDCKHGERIAVLSGNCAEYLEALYAIWWAGCVAVPVNAKLHPREAAFILADAGVRMTFASHDWRHAPSEIAEESLARTRCVAFASPEYAAMKSGAPSKLVEREPTDLAWLFYTSGTTGKPKGAMLTHRNLAAMTFNYFTDVDAIDAGDCILHAAPVSHGSGLYNFAHLLHGAAQVFPDSGGFDPAEIIGLLPSLRGMTMFAAPTMVKRLTDHVAAHASDTKNLKTIVYGGGPMYVADLTRAIEIFGDKFVQIYGQGESPMTISALSKFHHADVGHLRHESRIASVGVAHSGVQLRICDEKGAIVATNEMGEIFVKGDTVMAGYWNNPDATADALQDGWLATGDLGSIDADGFLTLKDRSKDLIISGGSNIYPREIEEVLLTHPAVAEAAVIGRPDAEWGEAVIAFIVVREKFTVNADELDQHCLTEIARFKRPKEYRFVDTLPKNNNGKVVKTELRKLL